MNSFRLCCYDQKNGIPLTFTRTAAEAARDAAPEEIADQPQLAVEVIDYFLLF